MNINIFSCPRCDKGFIRRDLLEKHKAGCSESKENSSRHLHKRKKAGGDTAEEEEEEEETVADGGAAADEGGIPVLIATAGGNGQADVDEAGDDLAGLLFTDLRDVGQQQQQQQQATIIKLPHQSLFYLWTKFLAWCVVGTAPASKSLAVRNLFKSVSFHSLSSSAGSCDKSCGYDTITPIVHIQRGCLFSRSIGKKTREHDLLSQVFFFR